MPEPPKDVEQKEPAVCDGGPDFPLDFRQAVAFVHGIGDLDPSADGESGRIGRAAVVMMLCADRDSNNAYAISRESRYDMAEVEETIRNLKDSGILRADQPGVLFVSEWDADEAGVAVVAFMLHAMAGAGIVRRQMEEDAPAP